jgi:hypothetical protein
MLQYFAMDTHMLSSFFYVLQVFQIQTYVASISSGCFTCGMRPTCHSRLLQLLGRSQAGAHVWLVSAGTADPVWARKTSRRGKLGVGKRTGRRECPNARARLNVQALFVSEKSKNIKFN